MNAGKSSRVARTASGHDGRRGRRRPREGVVQCHAEMQVQGAGLVREHKMKKGGGASGGLQGRWCFPTLGQEDKAE